MTNGTDPPDIFAGTNPDPCTRGANLTIDVHLPSAAGTTITVEIADGEGFTHQIQIALNEDGNGAVEWQTPASDTGPSLFFDHPESATHVVTLSPP